MNISSQQSVSMWTRPFQRITSSLESFSNCGNRTALQKKDYDLNELSLAIMITVIKMTTTRPSQLAELSRSEFNPEGFSHSAYVKFFVTFATKVSYLTFCDKIRQFFIKEVDREGGNTEKMRKCRE